MGGLRRSWKHVNVCPTLVSRSFPQAIFIFCGKTMLLTRFIDSVVNVPVVLQRLWPTVQTVQNTAKFPALILPQGCGYVHQPQRFQVSRPLQKVVGSCRQLGKRQLQAPRLCTETVTRFAKRLMTCREDSELVHAPWTLVVLEAVVQGLGRKLWVFTPVSLLQPLLKGRAVHRTLKLETLEEPQTESCAAARNGALCCFVLCVSLFVHFVLLCCHAPCPCPCPCVCFSCVSLSLFVRLSVSPSLSTVVNMCFSKYLTFFSGFMFRCFS